VAARRLARIIVMLGGLLAWAVQFTIIYGVTSVSCALEAADRTLLGFRLVPAMIALATLAALAGTAGNLALAVAQYRRSSAAPGSETDMFLSYSAILISGFSLVAIAWHGVPAFILPSCS
jgi:hypothetical protein